VLATGPELIDDIKRAPDHILSTVEAKNGVYSVSMQNGSLVLIKDHLVPSATIHARHTERRRPVPYEGNSFKVNAGNSEYIRGGPRRTCRGCGRFGPHRRA
jgi:hypothetical protein